MRARACAKSERRKRVIRPRRTPCHWLAAAYARRQSLRYRAIERHCPPRASRLFIVAVETRARVAHTLRAT